MAGRKHEMAGSVGTSGPTAETAVDADNKGVAKNGFLEVAREDAAAEDKPLLVARKWYRVTLPIEVDGDIHQFGAMVSLDLETAVQYSHALICVDDVD